MSGSHWDKLFLSGGDRKKNNGIQWLGHMLLETAYAQYGYFPNGVELVHKGHAICSMEIEHVYSSEFIPLIFIRNVANKRFVLRQTGLSDQLYCEVLIGDLANYLEVCCPYANERPAVDLLLGQTITVPFFRYDGKDAYFWFPRSSL